jgi:hypothetical protein
MNDNLTKCCSKCGEEKGLDDFYRHRRRCKKCLLVQKRERYRSDPEVRRKTIEACKSYRNKNKEKILAKQKERRDKMTAEEMAIHLEKNRKYLADLPEEKRALINKKSSERYFANKEHHLKKNQEWVERNREKKNAYNKEYAERNHEKVKAWREKWRKNSSERLSDSHIRARLSDGRRFGVKNPPQELIELKRVQLKIHRAIKNEHS